MLYDIELSGERIHKLRIQSGYTQEKLARALNIDQSLLSHIEAGKRGCSVDLLIQLSRFFDVSLDMLVLGENRSVPGEVERNQLKMDIAELTNRLETFKKKL